MRIVLSTMSILLVACGASPDDGASASDATAHAGSGGMNGMPSAGSGGSTDYAGGGGSAGQTAGSGGQIATAGFSSMGGSSNGGGAGTPGTSGSGPGSEGTPGEWTNVTPGTLNLDHDFPYSEANFGVMDVLVDPAKPSDLYAFVCYQGVWKSTDYGNTWEHVSTGTLSSILEQGRPWTAAIDPNPSRDPETFPAIYTVSGYGSQPGVYKSTDGGVNFSYYSMPGETGQDVYSFDVDPYDSQHLIAGFHGSGMAESTDAGETWSAVPVPGDAGSSLYVYFVDTGDADSTSNTWLTISQWFDNSNGTWRTTNGGQSFGQVGDYEHAHGCNQMFQTTGALYLPGMDGVYKSTDFGATFVAALGRTENSVIGTSKHLYTSFGWATGSAMYNGGAPSMSSAGPDGTSWSDMTTPSEMWNGSKRAAVTFDGVHEVIVSGNWGAGIWRYVEP